MTTHTFRDPADGGVTAAAIENETESAHCPDKDAHWRLPEATHIADQARQERDMLLDDLRLAERRAEGAVRGEDAWRARALDAEERERTLITDAARQRKADDITDEMVERGAAVISDWKFRTGIRESVYLDLGHNERFLDEDLAETILTAALTEPPARPDGAEELTALINAGMEEQNWRDNYDTLADFLAEHGVQVEGGGQ